MEIVVALSFLYFSLYYSFKFGIFLASKYEDRMERASFGSIREVLGKEVFLESASLVVYYSDCPETLGKDYQRGIFLSSPSSEEGLFWSKDGLLTDFCVALKCVLDDEEVIISYPETTDPYILACIERMTNKNAKKWIACYKERYRQGVFDPTPKKPRKKIFWKKSLTEA